METHKNSKEKDVGNDYSIVALEQFIQATRDSGYKGTPSAVAELVDNSIQAGATQIEISLTEDDKEKEFPFVLSVIDNGQGMDATTLRTALRFGGSSRFNNRDGLGRYGMGLPNSSMSQAQQVRVYSWRSNKGDVLTSYLDLKEIASGMMVSVPEPECVSRPLFVSGHNTGTAVVWTRCDRIDFRRMSTVIRKLLMVLGRRFRYFIWDGVSISVNGIPVEPIDPLYLHPQAVFSGARLFAKEMVYEIAIDPKEPNNTGCVRVRFSELPVEEWAKLSNSEKKDRGIVKGAGVSVIRGNREVDYGWFFLKGKRRENYDDWWRCEVKFDPVLDEAFGITHAKQQIRPQAHLNEILSADIAATARVLNSRARKAHSRVKIAERLSESEIKASSKDEMLTPLPSKLRARDKKILNSIATKGRSVEFKYDNVTKEKATKRYRIVQAKLDETVFFNYARDERGLILILNPEHPFYKNVYGYLLDSEELRDVALRSHIDLLLLAAARSEALLEDKGALRIAEQLRGVWSDTLATFLD